MDGRNGSGELLIVEGAGAARRELMHLLDAVVWVQSDATEAERRASNVTAAMSPSARSGSCGCRGASVHGQTATMDPGERDRRGHAEHPS